MLYYKRVDTDDDGDEIEEPYERVTGPRSFDCWLTEPEDRTFRRDLAPMLNRMNELEAQLADRDAEIERLKKREEDYCRKRCFGHGESDVANWVTEAAYQKLEAEIERLRADLVWAVREDCRLVGRYVWQVAAGYIECDGTPESICRAVREARGDG